LTAQLIEAATGNHLWADKYDGSLEDVFDFQDRIVTSLVGTIEPKLRATEIARAQRKRPDRLDAFDLYLRALPKVATLSMQAAAEAIELLDRAIGLSPNYAQALAYAAFARALRPIQGYSPNDERDFREAGEFLRRALDADPMDPVALSVAAFLTAMLRRDYRAGLNLIDRALTISPNDALSWGIRGWINAWAGETESAIAEFEKAMRLSPLDPQWGSTFKQGMANTLCWAGRAEEALPWVRSTLNERPEWSVASILLVAALWLSGRHAEAREAARNHVERFPRASLRRTIEVSPIRGTSGQERYHDALRSAGLPE
jgi:adenylate cyclase